MLKVLGIKRIRFFELLVKYRKDTDSFSIRHEKKVINWKIDPIIVKIRGQTSQFLIGSGLAISLFISPPNFFN